MIVQCTQCQTNFRVDPKKLIDRKQLRLRCSVCSHIFTVTPDGTVLSPASTGHVVVFCNQKGGVAKTTSCLNVGIALSRLGLRVLCVDFDPQANLSLLAGSPATNSSICDALTGKAAIAGYIQRLPNGLALLPANQRLNAFPNHALQTSNAEQILHKTLEPLLEQFDFILIDTPPALKFFTLNAIVASHCVIIPTQCAYLSMHGVEQIELIIDMVRKRIGRPKEPRLLLTLYDASSTAAKAVHGILAQRYGARILPHTVPLDGAVQESQILQQTLFDYAPLAPAAQAYLGLAQALVADCHKGSA